VAILLQETLRHEGYDGAQPSHASVEAQAFASFGLAAAFEGSVSRPTGTQQQREASFRSDLADIWASFAAYVLPLQDAFDDSEGAALWITPYGGCRFDDDPNDP
jgi:hypothetical protein